MSGHGNPPSMLLPIITDALKDGPKTKDELMVIGIKHRNERTVLDAINKLVNDGKIIRKVDLKDTRKRIYRLKMEGE